MHKLITLMWDDSERVHVDTVSLFKTCCALRRV